MPSISTKHLGAIDCPKCGRRGSFKKRIQINSEEAFSRGLFTVYFQVDHYNRGNSHKSGYSHSCYLGVEVK